MESIVNLPLDVIVNNPTYIIKPKSLSLSFDNALLDVLKRKIEISKNLIVENINSEITNRDIIDSDLDLELQLIKETNTITVIAGKSFDYYDYIVSREKSRYDKLNSLNLKYRKALITLEKRQIELEHKEDLEDLNRLKTKLDYTRNNARFDKILNRFWKYQNELSEDRFKRLMFKVYNIVHKARIQSYTREFDKWLDSFPNIVERKINGYRRHLRHLQKDPKRSAKSKEVYKNSELRFKTLCNMIESKGYYGFNIDEIRGKMNAGLENDEIVNDIIAGITDSFGNDHDLVEFNDKKIQSKFEDQAYTNYLDEKLDLDYLEYLNDNLESLNQQELNDYENLIKKYPNYLVE